MTLDTSSKMYSDKQAQDTVGPPHRWQILQGPGTEILSLLWRLFSYSRKSGGISPGIRLHTVDCTLMFEVVTVSDQVILKSCILTVTWQRDNKL